ncbi:MAG TPA: hypothetical protein VIK97_00760 [Casimicrobiaceae bacterium]
MSMVGFPLLLIPIAIYNIIAFLMPGVSFTDTLVKARLISGAEWTVAFGDILVALGVLMLLLEVVKGARPGAKYLTDHILSLLVFGAAAGEFLMWSKFANSTYFLLTLLALADFLSGITLRAHRGARAAAAATVSAPIATEPVEAPEPAGIEMPPAVQAQSSEVQPLSDVAEALPAPERQPVVERQPAADESQPAAEVASAASIAESVLMDHPEPKLAREPKIA